MEPENAKLVGTALLSLTSILGAYYLALKIREYHSADQKPTYVTHTQMERTKGEIMRSLSDALQDLRSLRAEIREETRGMQKQHARSFSELRAIVARNAESISALAATAQMSNQRIAELAVKTDRLALKLKEAE